MRWGARGSRPPPHYRTPNSTRVGPRTIPNSSQPRVDASAARAAFTEQMTERITRAIAVLAGLFLAGCGVVAAPCRVTSAVIDMVPLVGHVAATPTDACAEVIDPK